MNGFLVKQDGHSHTQWPTWTTKLSKLINKNLSWSSWIKDTKWWSVGLSNSNPEMGTEIASISQEEKNHLFFELNHVEY